jgi:hypothetical protein
MRIRGSRGTLQTVGEDGPQKIILRRSRFSRRAWFDQQHEKDGEQRDTGEGSKDDVEGDVSVAQGAKGDIAEATEANTDKVHDAVAGGSPLGAGDLAEDGHVVAVEEAPAEAEDDKAADSDGQRAGISHTE